MRPLSRRSLLTGAGGATGAAMLAGCGGRETPKRAPTGVSRVYYGRDRDNQFADLYRPDGNPVGTAVLIHGGYWLDQYGADLMNPMAKALQGDGWAVWNLEYHRLGSGGGWPTTFDDTAAGIDRLAEVDGVPLDKVVVLGHSAGGQLAAWAASRTSRTPGGASRVRFRGAVSLAGVLALTAGEPENLGGGVIDELLGGTPEQVPQRYRLGDPTALVPASCPVAVLRGRDDDVVPRSQAMTYVAAARAAGGEVGFTEVGGDHFTIIDPTADSWSTISRALREQAGARR